MLYKIGNNNPNWKRNSIKYSAIHKWLVANFGKANKCKNPFCDKTSKRFEWCLLKGMKYERKKEHYIQLCHKCHQNYDYTQERRDKIKKVWRNKEFRKKMSEAHKGYKMPESQKKNISLALMGNKWNLGKKFSEKRKQNISRGLKLHYAKIA